MVFKLSEKEYKEIKSYQEKTGYNIKKILTERIKPGFLQKFCLKDSIIQKKVIEVHVPLRVTAKHKIKRGEA